MSDLPGQRGQEWLEALLQFGGLHPHVTTQIPEQALETEGCWLTIDHATLTSQQIEALIGPDGQTIDAIQYLANTILNLGQTPEDQQAYTVEIDRYRVQRQAKLRKLADAAAEHVNQTGEDYVLKSLSAAERRIIHTYLKQFETLETFSQGQEPHRYLTVRPAQSTSLVE
jgi:spoIIIJ-associated protein